MVGSVGAEGVLSAFGVAPGRERRVVEAAAEPVVAGGGAVSPAPHPVIVTRRHNVVAVAIVAHRCDQPRTGTPALR